MDEYTATQNFTLTVNSVNDAPVFVVIEDQIILEDTSFSLDIEVADVDNTELILTIVEAPTWIEISGFSLSGLPTVDNIGSYQVSLSISDNIDVVTETFNVLVQEVNDYPITSDVSFISDEDQELEIILSATDEESEELIFDIVSQPQYGTITSNRSLEYFIYTPNANYNGTDSFTYSVSDGELEVTAEADITVNPINDSPYFITSYTDLPSAIENQNFICPIEIFDVDNDSDDLSVTPLYLPSWLFYNELELLGTPNMPLSEDLAIEITLSVTDGELSTSNNFLLNVQSVNNIPVSYSQNSFVLEDDTLSVLLIGNDSDNDELTYLIVDSPLYGTIDSDGANITYIPNENINGSDSFTYKVNDGEFDSDVSTVTITITEVNDSPESQSLLVDIEKFNSIF